MNTQLNTEYRVVSDEALHVAQVLEENGFFPPQLVDGLPENWWSEDLPADSILNSTAQRIISLLRENDVEIVKYSLWHPPHEKPHRPEVPEDVEIPWDDIGKILLVVGEACFTALKFLAIGTGFLVMLLLSAIDPWLVVTLPSGEQLKVWEWTE